MTNEGYIEQKFDERQLLIRGQVFWHGLLVAMILLGVNGMLQSFGSMWTTGTAQNYFIFFVVASVVAMESILRGVFFGRGQSHWAMIVMYGIAGSFNIVIYSLYLRGPGTALDRSGNVVMIISGVLLIGVAVVGLVRELADRRQDEVREGDLQ